MMLIRKQDRFFLSYNQFRILKLYKEEEEIKLNVTYFLKLSKDDLFTIFFFKIFQAPNLKFFR